MEFDTPETIGGGTYLEEAGTYHFAVNEVYEGTSSKGTPIQGFTVDLQVIAGTTDGQEGKLLQLAFFNPNLAHKEEAQRIARQAQAAFLIATGCLDPAKLGTKVTVDLSQSVGSQIVATVEVNDYNDQQNIRLRYADVWHVDDPRTSRMPKDASALEIIPAEMRKGASYFEPLMKKKAAASEAPSRISDDDLSDL